jgi:hypothetical protein
VTEPNNDSRTKVFFALPVMTDISIGLVMKLFEWAKNPVILPRYHFIIEKRHHDYARNMAVEAFLQSDAEYLAFVDSDVIPPNNFPDLLKHGKDIITARVHCWIAGKLLPSVWMRAACEQCRCVKIYRETGKIHDPSQYVEMGGFMYRWNPERQEFSKFADRENGIVGDNQCRCKGTGIDPWVYQTYLQPFDINIPVKIDSMGTAACFIHRRVFEKIPPPWFSFYYKPNREILLTEDHYFGWKAALFGFDIFADMKMTCSHIKQVDLMNVEAAIMNAFERGKKYGMEQALNEKPPVINAEPEINILNFPQNSIIKPE